MRQLVAIVLGVAALGVSEVAVERLLGGVGGPVPAMLLLFGLLAVLRRSRPGMATALVGGLRPAVNFLLDWMPIFFAPALVAVPAVVVPQTAVLVRVGLLVVVGFALTLAALAVLTTLVLRWRQASAPIPPEMPRVGRPPELATVLAWLSAALLGALIARLVPTPWWLALPVLLTATVAAWLAGLRLPRPVRRWLHPVVACALGFHAFLALSGLDLATYQTGDWTHPGAGDLLMALLKPAVMALALQLDERRELLRNHLTSIGIPVLAGSLATLVFQAWVGRALDLSPAWTLALVPRSVTIPIALPMARQLGADGNLTASVVVVTGLLGAVLGRNLLDRLRISSPVARGVAMGGAAHGLGTATMVAPEPAAGAVAALVYALFGMASASWLAVPWVEVWLRALAG